MKDALTRIRDKHNLPHDWLNTDFKKTTSYSDKLYKFSVYYKTFSNVLTVRIITAKYLLAMKLMSGRAYKYDLSDIVGILREHQLNNTPISRKDVEVALTALYDKDVNLSAASIELLDIAFNHQDYEELYLQTRNLEIETKKRQIAMNKEVTLIKEESANYKFEIQNQEHTTTQKQSLLKKLEEKKQLK